MIPAASLRMLRPCGMDCVTVTRAEFFQSYESHLSSKFLPDDLPGKGPLQQNNCSSDKIRSVYWFMNVYEGL